MSLEKKFSDFVILFLLSFGLLSVRAEISHEQKIMADIDTYIAKIYPALDTKAIAFEDASFDRNYYLTVLKPWLDKLEAKTPESNLNAVLALSFSPEGQIASIELLDLLSSSSMPSSTLVLDDFKNYIKMLSAIDFEPLPSGLRDYCFLLETRHGVIVRDEKFEQHQDYIQTEIKNTPNSFQLYKVDQQKQKRQQAVLIEPDYFFSLRAGMDIEFSTEGQIFIGKILDQDGTIVTDSWRCGDSVCKDLVRYWAIRGARSFDMERSWDAASSGLAASLGFAAVSNGIAPLLLAGLSSIGSNMEIGDEFALEKNHSFEIKYLGKESVCKL